MIIKSGVFRISSFLVLTLLLCQCTPALNTPEPVVSSPKKTSNPYKMPTAVYLAMAKNQQGAEQQNSLLLAAGRMVSENRWRQAEAILTQTSDLNAIQNMQKNIVLAQIALIKNKPKVALKNLTKVSSLDELALYQRIQYHQSLAQAYSQTGSEAAAVNERIKLDSLALDEPLKQKNRRALWLALNNLSEEERRALIANASAHSGLLSGWLDLANIANKYRNNNQALLAALDTWQEQYTNHPAKQMLPNPLDSLVQANTQPQQLALLLPLSGALAGPGNAVKDGFMAAHKATNSEQVTVRFYDTSKDEIEGVYAQAIADGAQYIVGPLTKPQVAKIATIDHPVPTLLLNNAVGASENSYSLGLSATDEAMQVALNAYSKGYSRALVIAPKNEWGDEVTAAFSATWRKKGAQVVATLSYAANDNLDKLLRATLKIDESERREQQLRQLLGQNMQTITSRRQDFDMIFLLAYPSKARQIMPLLKYYYAADVPVFATSIVYSGQANALKDKDLDGLFFCDIPWVFGHQMGARNWPEQFNSYNRLYALGKESYALTTQLNRLKLFPADGTRNEGSLYLKSAQQVARVLEWGQFRDGLARSLGTAA